MRIWFQILFFTSLVFYNYGVYGQADSIPMNASTVKTSVNDSLNKTEQQQIDHAVKKAEIDSLRNIARGFPVIVNVTDTLFVVHSNIGESTPEDRARNISTKIKNLVNDDFLKVDSIVVVPSASTYDIVYGETIITKISAADAMWYDKSVLDLATELNIKIKESIVKTKEENTLFKRLQRLGLALLVIVLLALLFWLIKRGNKTLISYIDKNQDKWLKKASYNNYAFFTRERIMKMTLVLLKAFRWILYAFLIYISLPIIFSISPLTRNWSHKLYQLIWTPFKRILYAVWDYLPHLFTVLVIYFVMKYFIRLVKYIFSEIETENLKISGFYSDWARPTFGIIKVLLYAFTLILVFPYLPGSDSDIFKGVSIFIGVLFSLGSSSAVGNMIAGLMITYMRPFKIGDRIQIAGVKGDVLEKTLLVTRLKTPKNEVITIPNSSVLSGNTTNYTMEANDKGLIIHSTVTIGYDVPWKKVHKALIDAALKSELILKEPTPYVLQTSLDDFYVSYQINAYTREASRQARVYSNLHQNIQNTFNERGIEILSPHYEAARDGNMTTIPADYLSEDYVAPTFKVEIEEDEEENKPNNEE